MVTIASAATAATAMAAEGVLVSNISGGIPPTATAALHSAAVLTVIANTTYFNETNAAGLQYIHRAVFHPAAVMPPLLAGMLYVLPHGSSAAGGGGRLCVPVCPALVPPWFRLSGRL